MKAQFNFKLLGDRIHVMAAMMAVQIRMASQL